MPIWIYGVPPVPFITGICCRIEFLGRWDECGMYGGRGFRRVSSRKPRFLLQILEANRVVYLLALISWWGRRYLCVYASHTTDFFHFTSYGCHIKPSLFHTSCNQYQSLSYFKSRSHALRKSIKVVCTKITIVIVAFCVQSFFSLNKLSSVMNGALIVFSLGSKTKVSADIFLVFFEGSPRRMSFCVKSYKTYQKKKVTCQSNSGVLCF